MKVNVEQGDLRGIICKSKHTSKEYYSFLGIPYAKPPLGELRFMPPEPLEEKWEGVRDATREASCCIQIDLLNDETIMGTEDCLYLNVFTPSPPSDIKVPKAVMVYIHGGAYYIGSGSVAECSPDYLINYDIVLVTLNYRLHALGFLNVGLSSCAGNMGLKDQQLALKWIKRNIRSFGGDPDNITAFGISAGASSIYTLMLSPSSSGLFHKAIIQSAIFLDKWTVAENPKEAAFELGRKLGFCENDSVKLVEYLKKMSAKDICRAAKNMLAEYRKEHPSRTGLLPFRPTIETVDLEKALLTDYPSNLTKSVKPIPIISGRTSKEGRLAHYFWPTNLEKVLNEQFYSIIKDFYPQYSNRLAEVVPKIREFYFGKKKIGDNTMDATENFYGDLIFLPNFYEFFENVIQSQLPLYVYNFKFNGTLNVFSRALVGSSSMSDAAHGEDAFYLFRHDKMSRMTLGQAEKTVIDYMCSLWTNFAKSGNPSEGMKNVQWKPYQEADPQYLQIDEQLKLVPEKMFHDKYKFWKSL